MLGHRLGDAIDALEDGAGGGGIGDFQLELLVEGHHQLQGIHRIQPQTAGAEQRQVIRNLRLSDLQHEILNHQFSDLALQFRLVTRHNALPSILPIKPVMLAASLQVKKRAPMACWLPPTRLAKAAVT